MRRSASVTPPTDRATGWGAAWMLGLAWAVGPLLPPILAGNIPGTPWTDLYPSVWGLAGFARAQPGFPTFTTALAAPAGMPFYFSSPLHGWAAWPAISLFGPVVAYTVTLCAARLATVLCAFGALRALGLGGSGALTGAVVYGASPFFHGYAVEGIVEGTDGWALAWWAWMVARDRRGWATLALATTILSSWYLGMVACAGAAAWGLGRRTAWWSLLGLVLTAPMLVGFLGAAGGASPLEDDVRRAMGAPLGWKLPGSQPGTNPFALTAWVGAITPILALFAVPRRPGWAVAVLVCAGLSLGMGPIYDLPVFASVRFPYRWHAGTLLGLAVLAGTTVDALRARWVAPAILAEGLLLSPVEPIVPGAPAEVPAIYDAVTGPLLLEVPGPVALPPGKVNPSRPRARYLLYYQLHHGASSPWAPDFNGIGGTKNAPWLATFSAWDPILDGDDVPPDVAGARASGVTQVMVHRDELRGRATAFEAALLAAGAEQTGEEGPLALYRLPD